MFTGLVRGVGVVKNVAAFGGGKHFRIDLGAAGEGIAVGQSVAVNGACLTATRVAANEAEFDAVSETIARTNLGRLRAGDKVNLEPALKAGDALDGHMVLGHVDAMGPVLAIDAAAADNRVLRIGLPPAIRHLVAEKGSIAVDGISLTVSAAGDDWFAVSVIPITWENTTLASLAVGDGVNLEVDVVARYTARILQCGRQAAGQTDGPPAANGGVSMQFLQEYGFA